MKTAMTTAIMTTVIRGVMTPTRGARLHWPAARRQPSSSRRGRCLPVDHPRHLPLTFMQASVDLRVPARSASVSVPKGRSNQRGVPGIPCVQHMGADCPALLQGWSCDAWPMTRLACSELSTLIICCVLADEQGGGRGSAEALGAEAAAVQAAGAAHGGEGVRHPGQDAGFCCSAGRRRRTYSCRFCARRGCWRGAFSRGGAGAARLLGFRGGG